MTAFDSGFPKNPLSRRSNGQGGFLNQTADRDPRGMNSTGYSRQDVEEAKEGLKLLKSRMGGTKRSFNVSSHSANREREGIA